MRGLTSPRGKEEKKEDIEEEEGMSVLEKIGIKDNKEFKGLIVHKEAKGLKNHKQEEGNEDNTDAQEITDTAKIVKDRMKIKKKSYKVKRKRRGRVVKYNKNQKLLKSLSPKKEVRDGKTHLNPNSHSLHNQMRMR